MKLISLLSRGHDSNMSYFDGVREFNNKNIDVIVIGNEILIK